MQSAALIIEDDKLEAERLGELVTDQAWRAVICHDVASACRLLKLEPFQLLMIDLGLEKESALSHLPALRKLVPATPIAVMAAATRFHDLSAAIEMARKAGADFTFSDTIDTKEVRRILSCAQAFKPVAPQRLHAAVIDTCRTTRHMAIDALSDRGYRVSEGKSMEDALKTIRMGELDLVVTEIFMPGIGGIEGIRHIRVHWPHVRIIAMSGGLDDRMTADKALLASRVLGAEGQLAKPFTAGQLVEMADAVLAKTAA